MNIISVENLRNQIVSNTLIEGPQIEVKSFKRRIDYDLIVKIMISFANTDGGYLILGLTQVNHKWVVTGLPNSFDEIKLALNDAVGHFAVNLNNWHCSSDVIDDKEYIIIYTPVQSNGIAYFNRKTSEQRRLIYIRQNEMSILSDMLLYHSVYKYMTLDTFITSLEYGSWRFFEPNKWPDKYERRFYCANYINVNNAVNIVPRLYATCVTRTKNSEAAWKVYARGEGLQAHCVQLELDIVKLRQEIALSNYMFYEKRVNYLAEHTIFHLHENTSKSYHVYFNNFSLNSFIELLSLKRDAFSYENEVRLFLIPDLSHNRSVGKKSLSIDVNINWCNVIKSIRVDSKCSDSELIALCHSCIKANIYPVIKGRELPPFTYNASKQSKVDVVLFDIDEMPGVKRIVIK